MTVALFMIGFGILLAAVAAYLIFVSGRDD